jgi:methylmalonyl-CoA mutase cobalamin-binding subunit
VLAGTGRTTHRSARALTESLDRLGVETVYLGREGDAARIAAVVVDERADAVEVCLSGGGGVVLLRQLLRELTRAGRRDVSIGVHRIENVIRRPTG